MTQYAVIPAQAGTHNDTQTSSLRETLFSWLTHNTNLTNIDWAELTVIN